MLFWVLCWVFFPSPFGWCCPPTLPLDGSCLPYFSLGGGVFFPAPFGPVLFLFWNQHHPKKGEEGNTTQRRRRTSSPTRKGGEGKQHNPNGGGWTTRGGGREAAPPKGGLPLRPKRRRKAAPPNKERGTSPSLPSFRRDAASRRLLWVVLPSSAFFKWRGRSLLRMN